MQVILEPALLLLLLLLAAASGCELRPSVYERSCPQLQRIVRWGVESAFRRDPRVAAALLRLHFHDCFVNGCDASVLLDDTKDFTGEKGALPNANSLRGYDVVDKIKAVLEVECKGIVSCADILALAARDAVLLTGGPSWEVELGRRDSRTANKTAANILIPSPFSSVQALVASFARAGLDSVDMVTLSGAHTIGSARCGTFGGRLYNYNASGRPDPSMNKLFLASLQSRCPPRGDPTVLAPLDAVTPMSFDNHYFLNLQAGKGVFTSDQQLFSNRGSTENYVRYYSFDQNAFFASFARSMVKLARVRPLTAPQGEVRRQCRFRN